MKLEPGPHHERWVSSRPEHYSAIARPNRGPQNRIMIPGIFLSYGSTWLSSGSTGSMFGAGRGGKRGRPDCLRRADKNLGSIHPRLTGAYPYTSAERQEFCPRNARLSTELRCQPVYTSTMPAACIHCNSLHRPERLGRPNAALDAPSRCLGPYLTRFFAPSGSRRATRPDSYSNRV